MKINLITIIIVFLLSGNILAQDIIIFRTGEEKEAIVKKVGVTTIEYVRYDNQNGALYEVLKDDVFMIKYQNGVKDVFELTATDVKPEQPKEGTFVDERDGEEYRWVKIGEQIWMGENLRYDDGVSPCLKESQEGNCDDCGRHYLYKYAMKACPEGWHLPTDEEWMRLEIFAGMMEGEAAKNGWRGSRDGQSPDLLLNGKTGLDLLLCGSVSETYSRKPDFKYDSNNLHEHGYYWTSTTIEMDNIEMDNREYHYYRHFKNRYSIKRNTTNDVNKRFSVRCVQDSE